LAPGRDRHVLKCGHGSNLPRRQLQNAKLSSIPSVPATQRQRQAASRSQAAQERKRRTDVLSFEPGPNLRDVPWVHDEGNSPDRASLAAYPQPRIVIRRLLARLIPGRPATTPRVFGPDAHPVRRSQLSRGATEVTRKLQHAGFKAFIVGGAVRDLLLGIVPKDFDIATDATPEQVKPLFRRAFIIGRRFKLVHVLAGGETIEVSTFRGRQTDDSSADEHGRLLSDNVFGTQAEDALRRDFTINALYYDPASETVIDFVGGMKDIRAKRLRLIGAPMQRYREDPVRMLRGIRLAAKLGLTVAAATESPI